MWAVLVHSRQPGGLNKIFRLWDESFFWGGGGLMRGIKIPKQNFVLKMRGGGGIFAGRYGIANKGRQFRVGRKINQL